MKTKHPMDFLSTPYSENLFILMFHVIKEFSYQVVVSVTQPTALGRNVVKIVGGAEVASLKYMC